MNIQFSFLRAFLFFDRVRQAGRLAPALYFVSFRNHQGSRLARFADK